MSKSRKEILVFFSLILSSLLLPVVISCVIYLKLLCYKKRWFRNEVAAGLKEEKIQASCSNGKDDTLETAQVIEDRQTELDLERELEIQAQVSSSSTFYEQLFYIQSLCLYF